MKELIEIPLVYRLLIVIAAGIILGNLANLIAFALSSRPGRSPWSQLHPHDAKSRWLDRLPILGWLRLSRKSEQLGRGFWVLPLLAELSMAALCGCLYWWEVERSMVLSGGQVAPGGKFAPSIYTWGVMHEEFAAHVVLAFFMLAATLIDFDERIIPDEITVPGTLIGLILAAVLPWTLMPVDVHLRPGIQYVEFMTLVYPDRSYGPAIMELDEWPAYLEAPKQTLPLIVAIAVYWFWCLSLLPWLWLPRRGFEKAVRMFIGHAMRSRGFLWILMMAVCGAAGIGMVWRLGGPGWAGLLTSLAGLAMGGALIWSVRVIFSALLGKEAMGFGDVTLLAMIGTYLGWQAPIFIFFLAPCIALLYAVVHLILGLGREVPYGPFLCMATIVVIVAWRWIWNATIEPYFILKGMPVPPILAVMGIMVGIGALLAIIAHFARTSRTLQPRA